MHLYLYMFVIYVKKVHLCFYAPREKKITHSTGFAWGRNQFSTQRLSWKNNKEKTQTRTLPWAPWKLNELGSSKVNIWLHCVNVLVVIQHVTPVACRGWHCKKSTQITTPNVTLPHWTFNETKSLFVQGCNLARSFKKGTLSFKKNTSFHFTTGNDSEIELELFKVTQPKEQVMARLML